MVLSQQKPYNDLSGYFRERFGQRVQKLSVNAGFTCPNRDGTVGVGGCTFCNNSTFNPSYCEPEKSVEAQLRQGMDFFKTRYDSQMYLAYFQAYSNTYASLDVLKKLYEEAIAVPGISGLVIGTRPDCVDPSLLEYLEILARDYFISVEYGVESAADQTLQRVNRGHNYTQAVEAIVQTAGRGLHVGAHFILGLPGENETHYMKLISKINTLPLDSVKFHQLQIVKGTAIASEFDQNPSDFQLFDADSYIDLVIRLLEKLKPDIIVERFVSESPKDLLIAPRWGMKNFEVVDKLVAEMNRRNTWQGRLF